MPKARVLIVDDAIFMRNRVRDAFATPAFEVVGEAANGKEAVDKAKSLAPDIVTMDVTLPEKSGLEATREILARAPKTIVVMCSDVSESGEVQKAIAAGALDFVVKPFSPEDLRRKVEIALQARAGA